VENVVVWEWPSFLPSLLPFLLPSLPHFLVARVPYVHARHVLHRDPVDPHTRQPEGVTVGKSPEPLGFVKVIEVLHEGGGNLAQNVLERGLAASLAEKLEP